MVGAWWYAVAYRDVEGRVFVDFLAKCSCDEEDEVEHLAPADSDIVAPTEELVFPLEGTKPVIPLSSTDTCTVGARITIRLQTSISLPPEAERLARCMAPPAHSSPPPVPSPFPPLSGCPTQVQTLRIASTQALIDAVIAALPLPSLLPLPPSLYIPPSIDRRDEIPESEQPPRKRLCLSTLGSICEVGESSTARGRGTDYGFVSTVDAEERRQWIRDVGYGIRDTWIDPTEAVPEIAPVTLGEDGRSRISQRADRNSQQVDLLIGDRMTLQETVWMVEEEAYAYREAWAYLIGLSSSGPTPASEYSHPDTAPGVRDSFSDAAG
ncbi:hypothetical protein Tco_1112725 [Tanacetum coccineum]|uniref:Uncharacterized protein n=1 Tax=Tanacetum coccineum TaxID=301880 RepID=A0ABQ5ISI3_9ASTR